MKPNRHPCDPCFLLPTRISVIVLATFQGGILNYYLVHYNNRSWYAWIAGDVAVIFSFFVSFFISYRELKIVNRANANANYNPPRSSVETGGFPLSYFAWLVYSVILAIRVSLIYKNFAYEIKSGVFFGTNMLKFTIAISGIVFLLLVTAHHNAAIGSLARHRINLLSALVPFDIIDCVDILSVFFIKESKDAMETTFQWAIIVIVCINLILPTVPLMIMSSCHFGQHPIPPSRSLLHKLLHIFVVNAPLLSLRILMWHKQGEEVSPLVVKNIVLILVITMDLYEGKLSDGNKQDENDEEKEPVADERRVETMAVLRYNNL